MSEDDSIKHTTVCAVCLTSQEVTEGASVGGCDQGCPAGGTAEEATTGAAEAGGLGAAAARVHRR